MNQKDLYQKVTNIILELLEKAQAPTFKQPWVNIGGGAPCNAHSKREYKGVNWLLLSFIAMSKGYHLNRWLSVRQANELNGRIRKGEKASPVVLYKRTYFDKNGNRYTPEQVQTISKEEMKAKEIYSKSLLYEYHVFNVAQIEGLPSEFYLIPNFQALTEFEKDEQAESLLTLSGAKINYCGNVAFYSSAIDEITLPTRGQFVGKEPFYEVAFHELAHWTGHPDRLNRKKKGEDDKKDYAIEELIAELTTAFVCASLGFESVITNNAAYLRNWVEALQQNNKIILTICADAQKAADLILKPLKVEAEEAA